jgi:hypothetical protein
MKDKEREARKEAILETPRLNKDVYNELRLDIKKIINLPSASKSGKLIDVPILKFKRR